MMLDFSVSMLLLRCGNFILRAKFLLLRNLFDLLQFLDMTLFDSSCTGHDSLVHLKVGLFLFHWFYGSCTFQPDKLDDLSWAVMHEFGRLIYRVSEDDVTRAKNQVTSRMSSFYILSLLVNLI